MALRPAAKASSSSGSDSDSDAPEAVSLSQSKKTAQKLEVSRQNALRAERQSRRLQNQQRDKSLKERAEKNKTLLQKKGKGKQKEESKAVEEEEDAEERQDGSDDEESDEDDENGPVDGLEARMRRAMKEAQEEESDEDEDEEEFESFDGVHIDEDAESGDENNDEDGSSDSQDVDSDSQLDSEADEEEEDEEEEEENLRPLPEKPTKIKFNPDHLPDEIFAAAFASQSNTKRILSDAEIDNSKASTSRPSKKRKRATKSKPLKDILVGSRVIQVLENPSHPKTQSILPSRKVRKFMDRTLSFKEGKQRAKGWERRPVNIGVLRPGSGPAANFVRNHS